MKYVLASLLLFGELLAGESFAAVGFQQVTIPDRDGKSMQAGIWYPSNTRPAAHPLGMFAQDVALDAPIAGQGLPLILISHGTGGSLSSHIDTANALARAGFVVLAVTHIGDNNQDHAMPEIESICSTGLGRSRRRLIGHCRRGRAA